jgi:hypothetical protein
VNAVNILRLNKMLGSSCLAAQLVAPRVMLSSVELVNSFLLSSLIINMNYIMFNGEDICIIIYIREIVNRLK